MSSSLSQDTFFSASVKATYLVFINNRTDIACLLAYQLTSPLFNIKTKPEIDFLVVWLLLQLESKYLFIIKSLLFLFPLP